MKRYILKLNTKNQLETYKSKNFEKGKKKQTHTTHKYNGAQT